MPPRSLVIREGAFYRVSCEGFDHPKRVWIFDEHPSEKWSMWERDVIKQLREEAIELPKAVHLERSLFGEDGYLVFDTKKGDAILSLTRLREVS